MPETIYNIQCFTHGFVGTVRKGNPLWEKCEQHAASGKLDAMIVGPEDCIYCREAQGRLDRTNLEYFRDRTDPSSSWYKPEPLNEEEQEALTTILKRLGIPKTCWNCPHYDRGYYFCKEEVNCEHASR